MVRPGPLRTRAGEGAADRAAYLDARDTARKRAGDAVSSPPWMPSCRRADCAERRPSVADRSLVGDHYGGGGGAAMRASPVHEHHMPMGDSHGLPLAWR